MSVGACEPLKWAYQADDTRTEYTQLYKVKGIVIMSKDTDTITSIEELTTISKEGKEIEVVLDTPVTRNTVIMIQEVLSYGTDNVGTYLTVTPDKDEHGEAKYTGVVLGDTEDGDIQLYTLMGESGTPEIWTITSGLRLEGDGQTTGDSVKLGGAIRFLAKDSNIHDGVGSYGMKTVTHIDVINKYV